MTLILRLVLAAWACAALAACAATSTLEPQNRPLGARDARIYVLRPKAWVSSALSANVKVNGKDVGAVANNSYLSVVRPPGRYKIEVDSPGWFVANEHDFQVGAGRTYYFVLNMKAATVPIAGRGFYSTLTIPGSSEGRPVGQPSSFAGSYLSELDAGEGAAVLSRLTPP
jgi:hypothetical protein